MALGAILGGAAVALAPVATQAKNEGFAATHTGQILIFPYYTVNGGWITLFNVTNVSPNALAVKVRFHESLNSRDVLDFNVLMSPQDVWTGYVSLDAKGNVVLKTTDKTCTSPAIPAEGFALNPLAYTGEYADGGPTTPARLTEGYVELIVMGECASNAACSSGSGIGYLTKHVNGTPRDCKTADSYFVASSTWDNVSVPGHGNPKARAAGIGYGSIMSLAPLKGNVSYVNGVTGHGAGSEALHLDNVATGANLVTAQQYPYFLEPTIATAPSGQVWNAQRVGVLEDRFNWSAVMNEWSVNKKNEVKSDLVINFPTKGYHVDQFCNNIQANNNRWRYDGVTVLTCGTGASANLYAYRPTGATADSFGYRRASQLNALPLIEPFEANWAGSTGSPVSVALTIYDREEGSGTASGTAPSPAPPQARDVLKYETNVVTIGTALEDSALFSPYPVLLDAPSKLASKAEYGWIDIAFPGAKWTDTDGRTYNTLPAYGFSIKTRSFGGNTLLSYGQMMAHGYRDPMQASGR